MAIDPGTPLWQWTCDGTSSQYFKLASVKGGYEITAQNSGLQLDVAFMSTDDGAPIIQFLIGAGRTKSGG